MYVLLKALVINVFKTRKYPLMLHAPTAPLYSPFLCVTFLQSYNLKRYHSKLLKIQKKEKACMKNITLKTIPTAAVDCVLILPTKNVSTRLYILVSSIEMMVGMAMAPGSGMYIYRLLFYFTILAIQLKSSFRA